MKNLVCILLSVIVISIVSCSKEAPIEEPVLAQDCLHPKELVQLDLTPIQSDWLNPFVDQSQKMIFVGPDNKRNQIENINVSKSQESGVLDYECEGILHHLDYSYEFLAIEADFPKSDETFLLHLTSHPVYQDGKVKLVKEIKAAGRNVGQELSLSEDRLGTSILSGSFLELAVINDIGYTDVYINGVDLHQSDLVLNEAWGLIALKDQAGNWQVLDKL